MTKRTAGRNHRKLRPTCVGLEDRRLPASFATGPVAALIGQFNTVLNQPKIPYIFTEPQDGREPILRAIADARIRIRLGICNLSDPVIAEALAQAAERGVDVRVIVDRKDYLAKPAEQAVIADLMNRDVEVHLSNSVFPRSFPKYLVIDRRTALIMTMCLVPPTFADTRDFGLVLANPAIIHEVTRVFENDWRFSAAPGEPTPASNPTPPVHVPNLIWGPVNVIPKMTALIRSARRTLDVTTEQLGDAYLECLLIEAVERGVSVRMVTPLDTREASTNAASIARLRANGIDVRVTIGTFPPPDAMPYMHAKTMVIDGRRAYLGSIDFRTAQTTSDRELGIVFRRKNLVGPILRQFEADWARTEQS